MCKLPEALYAAEATRLADRRAAAEHGLGDGRLMERAGAAAFARLRERWPRARRIAVVCGPGNNGGDGYVLARHAADAGLQVEVLGAVEVERLRADALAAARRWCAAGGAVRPFDVAALAAADLIVDALFGTGLERPLEGTWRAIVEAINGAGRPVLALDVPSGLHADSGRVLGVAVRAAVTVTFIALKAGLFTGQGREHGGLLLFEDLGVPEAAFRGLPERARRITATRLPALPPRARHAHKGEAGRLLIVGGAPGMPGAVRLAGEAAYRAGAGLVTVATHPGHAALLAAVRPELISIGVDDAARLAPLVARAAAVLVGPGLGPQRWGQGLWRAVREAPVPLVVDAEGLRRLAAEPQRREDWVLTPHPGEAAALLGCSVPEIEADRFAAVQRVQARYGGTCVLKGSGTLVSDGSGATWLCDRGTPALASAGTGDVLAGALAALRAQGLAALDAARLAVWAHAVAGEQAAGGADRGLLATDLLAPLAALIRGRVRHGPGAADR